MLPHKLPGTEPLEPTILAVDDSHGRIKSICDQVVPDHYKLLVARHAREVPELARNAAPDAVVFDALTPGQFGPDIAEALANHESTAHIPLFVVTAPGDRTTQLLALSSGVHEVVTHPIDPAELYARSARLVRIKRQQERLRHQLRDSQLETVQMLTRAAEFKDEDTGAHVKRISYYASELAFRLGMGSEYCDLIFHASAMHDVGKIAIPDAILRKQSKLEPHEWELMKTHTRLGGQMLAGSSSPYVALGAEVALRHHERWDGSGYPDGLRGEEIPLAARIMTLGDIYDALRSSRPYKQPYNHEEACRILLQGDGRTLPSHFDPAVLAVFEKATCAFREIYENAGSEADNDQTL